MIVGPRFILIALLSVGIFASTLAAPISTSWAQFGPELSIAENIPAVSGEEVTVPLVFSADGETIGAIGFSIDFDEGNLSFDPADGNADGVPDSVNVLVPASFGATVIFDAADTDGELDIAFIDVFPPIAAMPDGVLAEITFTAIGVPSPGNTITAPVLFSTDPDVSFGDDTGTNIPGTGDGGSVLIERAPEVEANLTISKSASPNPAPAGGQATYTLTVMNEGPSDATNVVVSDSLPAGTTFDPASSSAGCTESAGIVTCDLGSMANQASDTVTIAVDVDTSVAEGTVLTNTAEVNGDQTDPVPGNNTDTADVTVTLVADLSIEKTASDVRPDEGDSFTYSVEVINNGPSNATGVMITDNLPGDVTFDSGSSTVSCSEAGGVVTCPVGDLAANANAAVVIGVTVNQGTAGSVLTNTATVSGDQSDSDLSDNDDTVVTTVATPGVGLFIDPQDTIVPVNRIFDLDILVRADQQLVSGIQAFVNFDPTKLEVQDATPGENGVQIQPGGVLTDFIQTNSANNATGQIDFITGNFPDQSGFPNGDFVLATIRFKALEPTNGSPTPVEFSTDLSRNTIVSLSGEDVTGALNDGQVVIVEGADLQLSFQFQGGARPKPDGWEQEVTVRFEAILGGEDRTFVSTSAFDAVAEKALVDVPAVLVGTYDIFLTGPGTLTNVKRGFVVEIGSIDLDMGILLSGNAINAAGESTEVINIIDFTLLSDTFLKSEGDPDFDVRADFDANGIVNILDVGLLSINFLTQGPIEIP